MITLEDIPKLCVISILVAICGLCEVTGCLSFPVLAQSEKNKNDGSERLMDGYECNTFIAVQVSL